MRYEKRSANDGGSGLEVEALDGKFRKFERRIRVAAAELLRETGNSGASVGVYLVGPRTMDKNVLSFPAPKRFPRPDVPGKFLGEVYLNPGYIEKHGENLHYMLVHGFLHLLGYDHVAKGDRIAMECRERVLMEKLNFPSQG